MDQPLCERRRKVEKKKGLPTIFTVNNPIVGRGSPVGGRVLSGEEVERRYIIASEKLARRHGN
jgi:hypothetical protein